MIEDKPSNFQRSDFYDKIQAVAIWGSLLVNLTKTLGI